MDSSHLTYIAPVAQVEKASEGGGKKLNFKPVLNLVDITGCH